MLGIHNNRNPRITKEARTMKLDKNKNEFHYLCMYEKATNTTMIATQSNQPMTSFTIFYYISNIWIDGNQQNPIPYS